MLDNLDEKKGTKLESCGIKRKTPLPLNSHTPLFLFRRSSVIEEQNPILEALQLMNLTNLT